MYENKEATDRWAACRKAWQESLEAHARFQEEAVARARKALRRYWAAWEEEYQAVMEARREMARREREERERKLRRLRREYPSLFPPTGAVRVAW